MTTKLNDAFNIETATEVITTRGEVIVPNMIMKNRAAIYTLF